MQLGGSMDKTQFTPLLSQDLCPFDSVKWEGLKGRWNCSDQELYHCLPNQYNKHGQICVKPNWVLKNYCPIYNTAAAKIDLIPCDSQYGACSDNDYKSNLVYMYSGCLNNTKILKEKTTDTPPIESIAFPLHFMIIIVVATSLLLLLAGSIFFYCTRRKAKNYETGYEVVPLLGQSEIPTGFQKTHDYLKNRVFSTSKFYEHAIGALDIYRCITIVGPPGCGKTLTALQLAFRKCGRGIKSQLYFCQTLEEVLTTAREDNDAYIIVDEFLDKYFYYPSTLCEAIKSLDVIYNELIKGKKIHLIITVQEDKWSRFRKSLKGCRLFNQPYLLTINSKTFSEMELQNMVRCHFNHFDIEESYGSNNDLVEDRKAVNYKDISANQAEDIGKEETDPLVKKMTVVDKGQIETPAKQAEDSGKEETGHLLKKKTFVEKGTIGIIAKTIKDEKEFSFPVVVDLICTNKRLMMALNRILDDGLATILKYFFDTWSNDKDIKEKRSFCIIVLAALLGGEISQRDLSGHVTGPVFNRICSKFKCLSDENKTTENETERKTKRNSNECDELQRDKELFTTNLRLKSCLFRISRGQDDPLFVFQHSSLLRYVLLYVQKTKGEDFLIENATMKVLLNYCWLEVGIIDKFLPGKEKTTHESPIGSVIVSTSAIKLLARRIFSEVKDGYRIPDWEKHVFMNRKIFFDLWGKCTKAIQMQESGVNNEFASNAEKTCLQLNEN